MLVTKACETCVSVILFVFQIIQGMQLFTNVDRRTLEVVYLYLIAIEAVLLPHTLWLLSRRYRHALTYQWKVYVLRNKDIEEEGNFYSNTVHNTCTV